MFLYQSIIGWFALLYTQSTWSVPSHWSKITQAIN